MYGPAVRHKTDFQDDEREVLHQCIIPAREKTDSEGLRRFESDGWIPYALSL